MAADGTRDALPETEIIRIESDTSAHLKPKNDNSADSEEETAQVESHGVGRRLTLGEVLFHGF